MEIRVTTAIGQTNSDVFHETSIHIHFRKNLQINYLGFSTKLQNSEPNLDQLTSLKDRHGCSFSFMSPPTHPGGYQVITMTFLNMATSPQ